MIPSVYISEMRCYEHYLHFSDYCPHLCRRCSHPIQPDGEFGRSEFVYKGTNGGSTLSSQRRIGL